MLVVEAIISNRSLRLLRKLPDGSRSEPVFSQGSRGALWSQALVTSA